MADELDAMLDKIDDHSLRAQLRAEIDKVRAKRTFGLVFESHLPERVLLPEHPVRRGAKVVRRGAKKSEVMRVVATRRREATVEISDGETATVPVADLVVVAEFGEPVYPGLNRLGSINRGGDKPAHLVINAENHHALEMLQFTHAGRVDCIYIDPPYNTGAKDWKYDNNYVDSDDAYRHSKWLAFMERRLLMAKQLLNPDNSVLIVTIDEKEYLRLGLLVQQTFPSAVHQMVTAIIKPEGTGRVNEFSRTNEFIFFVQIGTSAIKPTMDNMFDRAGAVDGIDSRVEWRNLRRRERESVRGSRPRQFYAVFVDESTGGIHSVGDPLADDVPTSSVVAPQGTKAVFPVNPNGTETIWSLIPDRLRQLVKSGYARYSGSTVQFLNSGTIAAIEQGEVIVEGHDAQGAVIARYAEAKTLMPKTVWARESHNAQASGTLILGRLIPGRHFPFPKSLYAVEDALRFFLKDKQSAVVLDFFAGSGTTAHAVMRLNRQDGGRRQAIVVTNNEVSAEEAKSLSARGLRDGDPEWEALGIYEHITRPRVTAALTGLTPEGAPIKGDYKFTDEFPMADGFEENVEFVKLTYLDPVDVELDRAFEAVAPLLWMRAGGQGVMVERRCNAAGDVVPFAVADRYGVLFDPDRWREFLQALPASARVVFVVTDSAALFAGVAEQLPEGLEAVRLYENYLTTFAINRGGGS